MISQQVLQGNWNEIKGKLRSKWGQLSNDDVQHFDGNVDRLMGLIERKTGAGRESVESFLKEVTANGSSAVATATGKVAEVAHQAADKVQEGAAQAADSLREGYDSMQRGCEEAEELVRRHPGEATAICFGAGLLTGLLVALLLRRE
jgi:uncharacterized protein YjbJ (UPF0337 family)